MSFLAFHVWLFNREVRGKRRKMQPCFFFFFLNKAPDTYSRAASVPLCFVFGEGIPSYRLACALLSYQLPSFSCVSFIFFVKLVKFDMMIESINISKVKQFEIVLSFKALRFSSLIKMSSPKIHRAP